MERPCFASEQEYGARFTDALYWRPYVEVVCARHGLACTRSVAGLPGTNPVFLVDARYAVKFYTELFDSAESFPIELEVYRLMAQTDLPAPALVAHGTLFPPDAGWSWPYLITSVVAGTSLTETQAPVTDADRQALAVALGPLLRRFHNLPLEHTHVLRSSWELFVTWLQQQHSACSSNHVRWATPHHLIAQIDAYLPPVEALIDCTVAPHLVHADLNADHVLGTFVAGRWQLAGLIDFGDALVGDRMYELVALHVGLFGCDKRLLRAWLQSYGFDANLQRDFVRRAMSFTLLHRFNGLGHVWRICPAARTVAHLDELATMLWDLDAPGLPESEPV